MRHTLLLSATLLGLATTAMAQTATPGIRPGHVPGVGDSYPLSDQASHILPGAARSPIAPTLPTPSGGPDAPVRRFLMDAQRAVAARHTGLAQEAIERAETAMLQRSVPVDQASVPDRSPSVVQMRQARDALAHHDFGAAQQAIAAALTAGS